MYFGRRAKKDHPRASVCGALSVFECFCEWQSRTRPNAGQTKWFSDYVQGKNLKSFSLAPLALAISFHWLCGAARKRNRSRASTVDALSAFDCLCEWRSLIRPVSVVLIKDKEKPSNFSRSRVRRSQCLCIGFAGDAREKRSIRDPVLLPHNQFSTTFVNGGHS